MVTVPDGWVPPNIKDDSRYLRALCQEHTTPQEIENCIKSLSDNEIYNGRRITDRESFENVVAIIIYILEKDGTFLDTKLCSGVLVNTSSVLTTRHCLEHTSLYSDDPAKEYSDRVASIKEVVFGLHYERAYDPEQDPEQDRIEVIGCAPFPVVSYVKCRNISKRSASEKRSDNHRDLLLLKLSKAVSVAHSGLANPQEWKLASSGTIVGFGLTEDLYTYGEKRVADTFVVSSLCDNTSNGLTDSNLYDCVKNVEFVAGGTTNPKLLEGDTCTGDSGGPFFIKKSDSPHEEFLLAGVTSRSIKRPEDNTTYPFCGLGGVYVQVSSQDVRDWLTNVK